MGIEDRLWTPSMAQDKQHPFWQLESDEEGYSKEGEEYLQDNGNKESEGEKEDKFGYYGNLLERELEIFVDYYLQDCTDQPIFKVQDMIDALELTCGGRVNKPMICFLLHYVQLSTWNFPTVHLQKSPHPLSFYIWMSKQWMHPFGTLHI